MDTILHVLDIGAAADDVYSAVAGGEGLSRWWTTRVAAEERVGGQVRFRFIPDFNPEMEITELNPPGAVGWKCVGGAPPWLGSSIRFEINALDAGHAQLTFRQRYATDMPDAAYGVFNFNWGYYLRSLQQYLETGTGTPHPGESR